MRKSCLQHKSHRGLSLLTGVHSQGSTNPHASSSVCLSVTDVLQQTHKKPKDKADAYLTETQWHADVICVNLYAKHWSWFLSYRTECHSHHFHVRQRIWKAHFQGYGWSHFNSVVHWQYVVSYAYSRYVNVFLRKKKKKRGYNSRMLRSRRAHRIRSWFYCSALRSVQLSLTLNTPPALLCKQMFLL